MSLTTTCRYPSGRSLTLGLVLIIMLSMDICHYANCAPGESDIWSKYRPVAMDESWSTNGGKLAYGSSGSSWGPAQSSQDWQSRVPDVLADQTLVESGHPASLPASSPEAESELLDVEQYRGQDVKDVLFRAPTQETSTLTKLISGGQTPTFFDEQVKMPELVASNVGGPLRKDRVLARYKFIVPIYIPAIKLKKKAPTVQPKVRFVKEQQIEMIPVKQVSTQVKEVIKAERVPQQLVTDFVQETDGSSVPARVDDKVRPDERVVSSVVQNID